MTEKTNKAAAAKRCRKVLEIEIRLFWKAAGFLLLFLMPVASYLVFETVTGNLQLIWAERAVLNILWIGVFYLLAFAISGTSRIAVPAVSLLLFVLAVAEALVVEFRGTPIMVWDLLAVRTAMTVADSYVIELTDEMWEAGSVLLWLNLLVLVCPARLRWWKERLVGGAAFAGAAVGFVCYFYLSIVPGQVLEINMWEMNDTYEHQGYILVTAISLKYIVKQPPQGYSAERLEEIYAKAAGDAQEEGKEIDGKAAGHVQEEGGAAGDGCPDGNRPQEWAVNKGKRIEEEWAVWGTKEQIRAAGAEPGEMAQRGIMPEISPEEWMGEGLAEPISGGMEADSAVDPAMGSSGDRIQPVNLICIMNESLSDLRVAGDFGTNQEYFPFLGRLQKNTVRGNLCMPVFGAWTSNSEFEFLTGDSMALLPSGVIAYQFYVKPETGSLVSTLKAQGYEAVAMHPYPAANWNRDRCYANMGFDEFVAGEDYEGCETIRNYVSDRADYQKIIERVEQKQDPDDRLFVFNVTMQNHGGYEGTYGNFEEDVWLTGGMQGKYPKAEQYLSLIRQSDEAFRELTEYFENQKEPTMIVMFGDHQPGIEDEFYDEIYGTPSENVPLEERLMWYETPFVIWTNYEQPERDMGRLGAVFLSSYVLELANLELSPFQKFLLEMSKSVRVVHPVGCYGKDGSFYSWEEVRSAACPYQELIADYECLVYNHSMEAEGRRLKKMFRLRDTRRR